jgi:hypothetical protein
MASDTTIALISAGSAIGGAFIGAVTGGGVDLYQQSRRAAARAKAGARLVALDLALADSNLKRAEADKKWWSFFKLSMPAWPEYQDVLAQRLSNDEFEKVSQAVAGLEYFEVNLRAAPVRRDAGGSFPLAEKTVAKLRPVREDATAAYNALARLGEHEPVGSLIHDA